MAIAPTGALFKSFTFDDIDSRDFGVYISGDYVFNSPERDIETIEIPGRNGAFILDKGRFHNITVTYPAGMFGSNGDDFAEGIRRFRNALAGKKGYCRLTDEYHPLEYRMAVYRGGLEVEPAATGGDNRAAQFDIVFECKPQRYLIQGDQPIAVEDGANLNNPTPFESRPLLQVYGYGDISINGETISVDDAVIGDVLLSNGANRISGPLTFSEANLHAGDDIALRRESYIRVMANFGNGARLSTVTASVDTDADDIIYVVGAEKPFGSNIAQFDVFFNELAFASGTALSHAATLTVSVLYTPSGSSEPTTKTFTWDVSVAYTAGKITMDASPRTSGGYKPDYTNLYTYGSVNAYSTKSALGEPLYFDMDIGEAYKIEDGEIISVNNAVSFPAELPVLQPGPNSIEFDNTVDELDIVPRWWEV